MTDVACEMELAGRQDWAMQGALGPHKDLSQGQQEVTKWLSVKVTLKLYALKRSRWQENGESAGGRPE